MATIQARGSSYRVIFQYRGKQLSYGLGKLLPRLAEARAARVDELLSLVKNGYLPDPGPGDVVEFLKRDGKPPATQACDARPDEQPEAPPWLTLAALGKQYMAAHRGSLASNTMAEVERHFRHLAETLGGEFAVEAVTLADLQRHVKRREQMTNARGQPVSAVTVQKDLVTLRGAWRWAAEGKLLAGDLPRLKNVRFRPTEDKLPFMTYAEVLRRLAEGGDPVKLWECLYLKPDELAALLEHVKAQTAAPAWLYPMVCLAGYTGVRRSELLRAEVVDVDLAGLTLTVREKKRKKGTVTTRRVPLARPVVEVLADWLKARPKGVPFLFAEAGTRPRSRTRGKTTGNAAGGHGRNAGVTVRTAPGTSGITDDIASDHLDRALAASPRWEHLRGWHVLRHSFISACANRGIDQRMIDAWVGHSTDQQRMRYRHLYPSTQQAAIDQVFG